jgi:hypothetical protein
VRLKRLFHSRSGQQHLVHSQINQLPTQTETQLIQRITRPHSFEKPPLPI